MLSFTVKMAADWNLDLQPSNLLMGIDDESVLSEYEKDELEHPGAPKGSW